MDFIINETPSMDNIYNSTYYKKTRDYEQRLSNKSYEKAKNPFQTGVVPMPSYSDMYMNPNEYNNVSDKYVNSLSGTKIPIQDFTHGNMQQFIRKGVTQPINLDNNSGFSEKFGYNDFKVKKTEIEPFFQPETDISLLRGMQDPSDFLKERTTITDRLNNYNPIQSIRVAPGLNRGYTSSGSGGFHQADSLIYAKPKTKEELRPLSDQRSSIFQIPVQAPKKSQIDKRGVVTPFNKNRPETTYRQTEDNWFKGQSYLKKDTSRPEENLKDTTRIGTHSSYYGAIKNQDEKINPNDDYGKKSILVYNTEKHEMAKVQTPVANLTSIVKAVIAPVTDALKITLKEYFIDSSRYYGNAAPQIPEKQTTYDPHNHVMKTTVKETTIHDGEPGNLTGDKETYSALYDDARTTVKETTIHDGEPGNLTGDKETYSALYDDTRTTVKETTIHDSEPGNLTGDKETYSALYDDTRTTVKETLIHDDYTGNVKVREISYMENADNFRTTLKQTLPVQDSTRNINNVNYKSTYVYDPSIVAKTTLKQTVVNSGGSQFGFISGILNSIIGGYVIKEENAKNTQRQYSHMEYNGGLKSAVTFIPTDRDADMNAEIDGTREMIQMKAAHTPNGAGKFTSIDKSNINMGVKRQIDIQECAEPTRNIGRIYQTTPIAITDDNITSHTKKDNAYENRLDSSLLSQIYDNPDVIKINPIKIECYNIITNIRAII